MKGLFITGSGTDVGKTFIAKKIVRLVSESMSVAVRKPVESDCQTVNGQLVTTDALALQEMSNVNESIDTVCAYKFSQRCSGEAASAYSNVALTLPNLLEACQSHEYVVIEGAGGLLSPIAQNTLNIDLAVSLALPVVIVVKDELGAVNQALLVLKVAEQYHLRVSCIVLNQIQKNSLNNFTAISHYSSDKVVIFNERDLNKFDQDMRQILNLI
jgi:dethiobiotin synthetase